ncbi:MAG: branched-chain amino acid transport system II carrier protein, partial [Clostridiaceae bacterium]|nr:branched-chain amino acid transport system II carrier protein [Clostridiaceae bacterium]
MINKFIKQSSVVYSTTLLFTGVVSVVDALNQTGIAFTPLVELFSKLPLYGEGLGWLLPAVIGLVLGLLIKYLKQNSISEYMEKEVA